MTFNWHFKFANFLQNWIWERKMSTKHMNIFFSSLNEKDHKIVFIFTWDYVRNTCSERNCIQRFSNFSDSMKKWIFEMYRPGLLCRVLFSVSAKAFFRPPPPLSPPGQRRGLQPRHLRPLRNFSSLDSKLPPLSQVAGCKNIYDGFRFQT